jgi:RNA polymerase sigma-70 factor (ECF subfamily)
MDSRSSALEYLYANCKKQLLSYAYKLTNNRDDAEDLLHDTLLRVNKYYDLFKLRDKNKYKTLLTIWALKIMLRIFLNDKIKKEGGAILYKRVFVSLDGMDIDSGVNIEKKIVDKEMAKNVYLAMSRIPTKYFIPMSLRFYGEYSYQEIAELTGIKKSSIGSQIRRGKEALKKEMEKVYGERFREYY